MSELKEAVRHALGDVSDFTDAIIYMADGALGKAPDYESAAYLESIKALAEKTQAAIEPAADALKNEGDAPATAPDRAPSEGDRARSEIPGPVAMLAREATYEIAALAAALIEHFGQIRDEDQRPLAIRGMASRIRELNGQVMSILDTPDAYTKPSTLRQLRWDIVGERAKDRDHG